MNKKIFFESEIGFISIDRSELDLANETIRIKNFPFNRKI